MFHLMIAQALRTAACAAGIAAMVLAPRPGPALAAGAPEGPGRRYAPAIERCAADLAARLHVDRGEIAVDDATATTWPDASLGMPRPGEAYAQVLTPGWRLVLTVRHRTYLYTASERAIRYGGPAELWGCSGAFVTPDPDDPNSNGTLQQISLLGTNPSVLLRHVSDFWPQADGSTIAKRREGRSIHTLLYAPAGGTGVPRVLLRALDLGPATVAADRAAWVAFVRQGLGTGWTIAYGSLDEPRRAVQHLQLPEGADPAAIGYEDEMLVAGVRVGGKIEWYRIATTGPWTLTRLPAREGAIGASVLLNRSETLEVVGPAPGEPARTRVVRRWFTGAENVVAAIEGFTFTAIAHIQQAPYVFLSGTKDGKPAAFTVNIVTGETIALGGEVSAAAKLCHRPPVSRPYEAAGDEASAHLRNLWAAPTVH